ncbi:MAG: hypothetical protein PPP58_06795 [Natronomonas sp.]
MSDESGDTDGSLSEEAALRRRYRLLGAGIVLSGLSVLGVDAVTMDPYGILVVGLGTLAVGALVFERLQGGQVALSAGLLVGFVGAWAWPALDGGSLRLLGGLLIAVGVVYAALSSVSVYFRRLGERLAD